MNPPFLAGLALLAAAAISAQAQDSKPNETVFTFAVSGDSRNCGDVVMPAIAKGVQGAHAAFYWHLGDFRAMYMIDEDIADQLQTNKSVVTLADYYNGLAWPDFIKNQLDPFSSVPVYLTPGNHETMYPTIKYPDPAPQPGVQIKAPGEYMRLFKGYRPKTTSDFGNPYYSWTEADGQAQFIAMDNSVGNDFDAAQIEWFDKILDANEKNPAVTTIVVGMHEALPGSISADHSMNQAKDQSNGAHVYERLLEAQAKYQKHVYALASHSHYYMAGIFNTLPPEKRIPGWIIGGAGAVRYPQPPQSDLADDAKFNDYGYAVASVQSDGSVVFKFNELQKGDLKSAAGDRFSQDLVDLCFDRNIQAKKPVP